MGTLKIQMGGYLRERILENKPFFSPVTDETLQSAPTGEPVKLKTGDLESRIEVRSHERGLEATFTYPLDSDTDSSNGRLYAEDKFTYDPETKEFEVHRNFRMGFGAVGDIDWTELHEKLKAQPDLDPENPVVKKFFNEVVLALPAPVEGVEAEPVAASAAPSSFLLAGASLTILAPYSGIKTSEIFAACLEEGTAFLLGSTPSERRSRSQKTSLVQRSQSQSVSELCRAVDQLVGRAAQGITDPFVLGALWVGGASFQAGEAVMLNRLGSWKASYPLISKILGGLSGIALEAPAFELSHRRLENFREGSQNNFNPWRWKGEGGLGQGFLRSYATFGVFRTSHGVLNATLLPAVEAGFQPLASYTAPVLAHSGSFATLHAVNEWERKAHLRENEGPWAVRLVSDGTFYAQMLLAGGLVEAVSGPKMPNEANFIPRKSLPEPPLPSKAAQTEADLPHFPDTSLELPAAEARSEPAGPVIADRRSSPPPSRPPPPKSFPPVEVKMDTRRFFQEIEGLNPDFEEQFRQGIQVLPNPETGEFIVRFKGQAPTFSVKDESIYKAYRVWRERVLFEQGGLAALAPELASYRVSGSVQPLLETPVLMPTEAVKNGSRSYYMGPLIRVFDSPKGEMFYVFALVTEYERVGMNLRKAVFYKPTSGGDWRTPLEGHEDMHLKPNGDGSQYTMETVPSSEVMDYLQRTEANPTVQLPMHHEDVMGLVR